MSKPNPIAPTGNLVRDELLRERFTRLWQRCLSPGVLNDAHSIWSRLERRYSESHRVYHDREHLAHCMEQLDLADGLIAHPDQVEMAIWFHDIINEPGASDNEQRSADYFRNLAGGLFDGDFVDAVVELILVTTHREAPVDPDQQFICDIDLASFGCPWECFLRDSSAVKAEFSGTEEEYYRGKKAFLQAMLRRVRIFQTDFFNTRYEAQSRDNIHRLLELIERRAD
jgi:predicted metal-dependent HD superfamily phosphohydrolase